MNRTIKVLGLDPSLNNWGIAHASLNIDTLQLEVTDLQLVETDAQAGKTVRKNSDDIRRARGLFLGMSQSCVGITTAFCEVPVGSQSARAMASYGICVGVLGACPAPLVEVTPYEVKLVAVGSKTAAKEEMIEWAHGKHPLAPWLKRGGKLLAKNEHLADAVAAIYAGLKTEQFQSVLRILRATND